MISMFHVTYDIVTTESAENGDTAENGFCHANGGRDPLERVKNAADYAMDLRSALRICQPQWDSGSWFYQEATVEDYTTDEHVSYSLHPPRNVTPASYARLRRLLGVR
jgi:hypothetical protein